MRKFTRNAFLLTCILSLQIIKPVTSLYAKSMTLTYDGKQHTYNKPAITLEIDNKEIQMTMPPVQIDERTLVPTREVFEPMGASVEWKAAEKKVFINHGDKLIVLEVDNLDAWVEGVSEKLDVPPKVINEKLMLPLRFLGQTLGYKVDWDHNASHISINQIPSSPDVELPTIEVPKLEIEGDQLDQETTVPDERVPEEVEDVELENVKYTNSPREAIVFKKAPGLSVDRIQIKDDYRNRKITVTLPENYSDVYNDGTLNIGSGALDKVLIQSNSVTEFIIHEKKIMAYDLIDEGENIKIIFMEPKEKHGNIILLDMGHGAHDPGASANGLVEKELNFEQGVQVYDLLQKDPDIKVYMTREDDSYPTNPARAQLANEIGADIFVSLHHNSFKTSTPNGTEILYSTKDPRSKEMAEILQNNMVSRLGTTNRGAIPGPRTLVLNSTNMPAVLVETAFVTNPGDAQKLKSPEFNKKAAQVIYDSIVEIFNTLSFR